MNNKCHHYDFLYSVLYKNSLVVTDSYYLPCATITNSVSEKAIGQLASSGGYK